MPCWHEGRIKSQCDNNKALVTEAFEIRELLAKNTEEIASALKALNGEFVPPEAGGDLLRDGKGAKARHITLPAHLSADQLLVVQRTQ
eukprot:scaffold144194_cov17-Prasinocladus_malaysianus.AAC.1